VFRIPGVGLGAHTIVGTISALTGSTTRTEVVGWHTETGPLPVVFCLKQPKLITYDTFAALGRPTDTSVDTVNTDIDTVAAAFDANVVSVDRDGAFGKQMALFMYYDGLTTDYAHPGPLGHELITATLLNAIRAYPTNTSDQTSVSGNAIQTQSVESLATSKTFGAIPNHEYVIILKAGAAPTFPTPVGNLARYRIRNTTGGTITLLLAAGTLDTVASPISLLSGVAPLTIVSDGTVYWTV
jgi:hypothetical protein